jgi:NitT/TauT family transport system substrate-binding protein
MGGEFNMKWRNFMITLCISLVMVMTTACGGGATTTSTAATSPAASPAASKAPAASLEKVSFRLDFVLAGHQAPFYVALEKGYYKEAGLDVSIKEGKGSGVGIQNVDSGADTFALSEGGVLMNFVSKGAKVRSVAGIFRTSPNAVIYKASDSIKEPKDITHLKIGGAPGSATETIYPAFLQSVGLDPNKYPMAVLESSSKLQSLIDGKVDGILSFAFLQVPILEAKGFKAGTFVYADYGINTPGLSIMASQKTIDEKPDIVRGFLKATAKGFKDAQASPDEAISIMKKQFPELVDEPLFKKVLVGSFPLFESKSTAGKPFGYMSEEDWNQGEEIVNKYIGLGKISGANAYMTNDFIAKE